jgi:hypothetical protein
MSHADLLRLPHAADLLAIHCALDDGGINEAGRIVHRLHAAVLNGETVLNEAEAAWFASLKSLYHSFCGSMAAW